MEEFEASVLESNSNYDEPCSDSSSTSSKGQVNGDSEPGDKEPVRRSACWVEMRRIKIAGNKSSEKKGTWLLGCWAKWHFLAGFCLASRLGSQGQVQTVGTVAQLGYWGERSPSMEEAGEENCHLLWAGLDG